ncbi:MAG: peptide ABC transporter substrate-binding protein [Planctomycetota bacterium]|nr:peptide ABC transporter substrate-binding protein [Planctomycetota bacterium]
MIVRRSIFICVVCCLLAGVGGADMSWVPEGWKIESPSGWDVPLPEQSLLAKDQKLVFNNGAEPETFDPHQMTGVPEHTLAMAIYEGLTTPHPKTLEALPGMADAWAVSPDRLKYLFHIRKDARWSNGDPVVAQDFYRSWKRVLEPEFAAQYAYQLYYIQGAEAFNRRTSKDFSTVGLRVLSPHLFEVTLRAPTPFFLELTYFETLMPVHLDSIEKARKEGVAWTTPERLVCNGPFVLAEHLPRQHVTFKKNTRYWNAKRVFLEEIVALPIDDQNAAMNKYLNEELDWVRSVPAPRIEEATDHPDYYVQTYLGTYYYSFNVTRKPFDDLRVRRAFSMAIDRSSVCRFLKGGQMPARGFVPPGIPVYSGYQGPAFDPGAARKLLAEAGFPGGEGFPEVELLYNTSESHKVVAEVIVDMWKKHLGVRVKMRNNEWKVYLKQVEGKDYQVARRGWIGDYADPNTFLDMWVSGGGNNNTNWASSAYDNLIRRAGMTGDPKVRMDLFLQAETLLVESLPVVPIYHYVNQGFLSPLVGGWEENIRDLHPFQFLYMQILDD